MASTQWDVFLERLRPAGDLVGKTWLPDDPQTAAEVHRQIMMNLSLGYFLYFQSDPAHPDFMPFLNSVYLLQPNPDDAYFNCPIDGTGSYRITGERGSVHLLTITVGRNMQGMTSEPGTMLLEIDGDTIADDAGMIDLVLSSERPSDHRGAWFALPAAADFILVRQRSYRWGEERDARLAITRVDPVPLKLRLSVSQTNHAIENMIDFAERLSHQWLDFLQTLQAKPVHEIRMTQFAGGVQAQRYWEGIFDIQPDEALIIETEVPANARYWNVQLNDVIWNTIEYLYRQSSLNGAQAAIDEDGWFRAVISEGDPGVPNWLDTAGHNNGTVVGRWYECDRHPTPTIRKVKLAEVRDYLPTATPMVSPAERAARLVARARSGQLRRRW